MIDMFPFFISQCHLRLKNKRNKCDQIFRCTKIRDKVKFMLIKLYVAYKTDYRQEKVRDGGNLLQKREYVPLITSIYCRKIDT